MRRWLAGREVCEPSTRSSAAGRERNARLGLRSQESMPWNTPRRCSAAKSAATKAPSKATAQCDVPGFMQLLSRWLARLANCGMCPPCMHPIEREGLGGLARRSISELRLRARHPSPGPHLQGSTGSSTTTFAKNCMGTFALGWLRAAPLACPGCCALHFAFHLASSFGSPILPNFRELDPTIPNGYYGLHPDPRQCRQKAAHVALTSAAKGCPCRAVTASSQACPSKLIQQTLGLDNGIIIAQGP